MSEIVAGADNMPLGMSERLKPIHAAVRDMIRNEIMPLDEEYLSEVGKAEGGNRFAFTPRQTEILESLKKKAKARGLWNFWLTNSKNGYGLTTVSYTHLTLPTN